MNAYTADTFVATVTNFMKTHKGFDVTVNLADGTTVSGEALSVNSKGVNIKRDGKTRSIALSKVVDLELGGNLDSDELHEGQGNEDDDLGPDDLDEEALVAHDGMTTRELAALVGTDPKSLRVTLRSLGLGVGKGRKYCLAAATLELVKVTVNAS